MWYHLREKDRRLQEAERRQREAEQRAASSEEKLSVLLQTWEEVEQDMRSAARRMGAEELPEQTADATQPDAAAGEGGRRRSSSRHKDAVLRLLSDSASAAPSSSPSPSPSSPPSPDASSGSPHDDDASNAQLDLLLRSRLNTAHDLLSSLVSCVLAVREENTSVLSILKEGAAAAGGGGGGGGASDGLLLLEGREEMSRKLEEMGRTMAAVLREGREEKQRSVRLKHELVWTEEARQRAEDERQRLETELSRAQRKCDKYEKEREAFVKKQKDAQPAAAAALQQQQQLAPPASAPSSASSSSSSSPSALPYDDMVDRSAVESLEQEKRGLQQQLSHSQQTADKRASELLKVRADLHRCTVELNRLRCEGVGEEAVKDSVAFKVAQAEALGRREQCDVLRLMLEKGAREAAEKEAVWSRERETLMKETERLMAEWGKKEEKAQARMEELMRDKVRAERERDEMQVRLKTATDRGADERDREEDDRRRLLEEMERVMREQETELKAAREQLAMTQQDRSEQRWLVRLIKAQKALQEKDAQYQHLLASASSSSAAAAESSPSVASLQAQVASLQERIASLTSDPELLSTLSDTNATLMTELDDLAAAHAELVDKQARLLLSLSELQREKGRLYDDKLRYKTMETLVKAESASLKQTIAALQRERDALQDSVRALEAHRQGVEEVVRKYEALKQGMERRLQHMATSVRETRLAALRVKEEKDGLLRAYGQRGKLLDERELRIATLEGQYSNAKDKYSELHQRLRQLQERERDREKDRGEAAATAGAGGGGDGEGGRAAMSDDRVELQQLKSRLKCGVCCINAKAVVISKCWHLFCADCVDANLKSRHRKCPACGEKFDKQDVHNVYGLDG